MLTQVCYMFSKGRIPVSKHSRRFPSQVYHILIRKPGFNSFLLLSGCSKYLCGSVLHVFSMILRLSRVPRRSSINATVSTQHSEARIYYDPQALRARDCRMSIAWSKWLYACSVSSSVRLLLFFSDRKAFLACLAHLM